MNSYQVRKISKMVSYGIEFECIRSYKKIDNKFIGKWIKEKAVTLGPTFVKIGQLLSTRKDILGKDFTDELQDLQDNISPLPLQSLTIDFMDISDQFEMIEEMPIASASIGQVHKARLKSGEDVVIKARRPGIIETIKDDFEIVMLFLKVGEKVMDSRRFQEVNVLFKEYYNILKDEVDFDKEIKNMQAFSEMFKSIPWIKIPKVYEQASNSNVITMEYAPSIKIDNVLEIERLNFNKSRIADKLIECYITQIIDHGFINLDPHPGNIGISESGKIVFYDFGMTLTLDKSFRESFDKLLFAIYNKDIDLISQIAIENEFIILDSDDDEPFKNFLAFFLKYIETLDVNNFKLEYLDVFDTSELNFMLSSKFVMLLRGITILEGVCKELDPSFKYSRNLDKYIKKIVFNIENIERQFGNDVKKMLKNNNNKKFEKEVQLKNSATKLINEIDHKINNTNKFLGTILLVDFIERLITIVF